MKAMEYCDGCKLARMAVDCYQRESHEFCGVFCMATGQMHFAVDSCPCGEKKPRQKTEMSSPVLTRDGKEDEK